MDERQLREAELRNFVALALLLILIGVVGQVELEIAMTIASNRGVGDLINSNAKNEKLV